MIVLNRALTISLILLAVFVAGCSQPIDPIDVPAELILVGSTVEGDVRIDAYAKEALHVGYNNISYKITHPGASTDDIHLHITPICKMGSDERSCPCTAPSETPNEHGLYECAIIFTSASDTAWTIRATVHNETADIITHVLVPVRVAVGDEVKTVDFPDGSGMVVTVMSHPDWHVGMNDVSLLVHASPDGVNYATVDSADVKLTPSMPSMGHGSSGNIDPKPQGMGLYKGAVNLIMSGEWALDVHVNTNVSTQQTVRFMILVP